MHADDLVIWLMTLAASASTKAQKFNVGSDEVVSVQALAHMIGKYFNVPASIADQTNSTPDRYVPSVQKAKLKLGLTVKYDLSQALEKAIQEILFRK
jgi:dTDP-glucose 4,6-dehydratase